MANNSLIRSAQGLTLVVLAVLLVALLSSGCSKSPPDAGSQSSSGKTILGDLSDLTKTSSDLLGSCVAASMMGGPAMLGAALPGASPTERLELAGRATDMSKDLKVPRVRKNYEIIAEEIRAHANDTPFQSPKLDAAIADVEAWEKESCPQGGNKKPAAN